MSCHDCEISQKLGSGYYIRVGNADIFISGCKTHIVELLAKLDMAVDLEPKKTEEDDTKPYINFDIC